MQVKITLRPEIYEKVKKNSKENMRTFTAEVNYMLKKAYGLEEVLESTHQSVSNPEQFKPKTTEPEPQEDDSELGYPSLAELIREAKSKK